MQRSMTISLRPFLPSDAPALARLFRDSIETLAEDDYTDDQRAAWASSADDLAEFAQKLSESLTLVALRDGALAGFASLADGKIDMLYVEPGHAGHGVATALVDALEKLGRARGAKEIETDASDVARDFFAKRGYAPMQRNTVMRAGEWLANTTMKKPLGTPEKPGATH
ncbi:MAG: GNAT family N-acetyltransferase [Hyphomicrobiales bacterium]|nr:GNAT family N-acetyltransferase [Hyphomicrobiales bacterium]